MSFIACIEEYLRHVAGSLVSRVEVIEGVPFCVYTKLDFRFSQTSCRRIHVEVVHRQVMPKLDRTEKNLYTLVFVVC